VTFIKLNCPKNPPKDLMMRKLSAVFLAVMACEEADNTDSENGFDINPQLIDGEGDFDDEDEDSCDDSSDDEDSEDDSSDDEDSEDDSSDDFSDDDSSDDEDSEDDSCGDDEES